jgi:hypothetical protein
MKECECDGPGGVKTYALQVCMPINGKVRCIDHCIHHIVAALNAGGVETFACCCGHKKGHGRIDLADGRVLVIMSKEEAEAHFALNWSVPDAETE